MKYHLIITGFLIVIFQPLFSQEMAYTENGDTVLLYSDGSWEYYDSYMDVSQNESMEIPENSNKFSRSKNATKSVTGKNDMYKIWYNPKEWKRIPVGQINPEADIAFTFLKGDVYGLTIYEELEIPIESLIDIALSNAMNVAPDMKIKETEYRDVNGKKMIFMRMDGTTQGMKISYYSYYYSNPKGTVQFHTFTGQNVIDKHKKSIEELLNGFMAASDE